MGQGLPAPFFFLLLGVILLDKMQGFWLLHSTPHFPPRLEEKKYAWPLSALQYGQTFLCITYPYGQFKQIGKWWQAGTLTQYKWKIPIGKAEYGYLLRLLVWSGCFWLQLPQIYIMCDSKGGG